MRKIILWLALILASLAVRPVEAAPPPVQPSAAFDYVLQREDSLSHLADKFYHNPQAWPAIWLATQQVAAKDPDFAPLDNPYFLKPGQLLLIPPQAEVPHLLEEYQSTGHILPAEISHVPLGPA